MSGSCSVFLAPFPEETVFSPLYVLVSLVVNKLTRRVWTYFWALYPIPLIYVSVFTVSIGLPFPECHIVRIIQFAAFSDWLPWFINMHWRSLHVLSWLGSSSGFGANIYLFRCITIYLFTYWRISWLLPCFGNYN